jgi:hypothetical protein
MLMVPRKGAGSEKTALAAVYWNIRETKNARAVASRALNKSISAPEAALPESGFSMSAAGLRPGNARYDVMVLGAASFSRANANI